MFRCLFECLHCLYYNCSWCCRAFDCRHCCDDCTCHESANPDYPGPPPPIRPIPLTKRAKPFRDRPPYTSAYPFDVPKNVDLEPTGSDVIRFRHHYGTNLGGYFVLEKWLHGSMFIEESEGDSELDAVFASVFSQSLSRGTLLIFQNSHIIKHGHDDTRRKWEAHWESALSDEEIGYLVHAGCTSVRLPIGHFTVGPGFCQGTPFGSDITGVYQNAWDAVKKLCTRLHNAGIGTLIDLHALPYGANNDSHVGTPVLPFKHPILCVHASL